jgi:hypothetical protein
MTSARVRRDDPVPAEVLFHVWVWEAPDLEVALKLATEASKVCDGKVEVRPFQ